MKVGSATSATMNGSQTKRDAPSSDTAPTFTAPKGHPFVDAAFKRGQKSGGTPSFNPADAVCLKLPYISGNSNKIERLIRPMPSPSLEYLKQRQQLGARAKALLLRLFWYRRLQLLRLKVG
jgi:hypothetical protein